MQKKIITAEKAFELLSFGQILRDMHIIGKLDFNSFYKDNFEKDFIAVNCVFEHLHAQCAQFAKTVRFTNCEFKKCEFNFTYFLGGLTIDNCIFDNYLSFEAGGHNQNGSLISITNSTFKKFVNFFDCLYLSQVIIENNNFQGETNLLGKPKGIEINFTLIPRIENNSGKLDNEDEGDMESQSVYLE